MPDDYWDRRERLLTTTLWCAYILGAFIVVGFVINLVTVLVP